MRSSILFCFSCFFLIALVSSAPAGEQEDQPQNSPSPVPESKTNDDREKALGLISNFLKSTEDPELKKALSALSNFIEEKEPESKTTDDESHVTETPAGEQDQDAIDGATHSLGAGESQQEPKSTDEPHAPESKPEETQTVDSDTKVPEEEHEDPQTSPSPVSEAPASHDDNDQDAKDAATHSLGEPATESEPKPTEESHEPDSKPEDLEEALKKLSQFLESQDGSELKKALSSLDNLLKEKSGDDSPATDAVDQDAKDAETHSLGEHADETKPDEAQVPEQKPPGGIRGAILGFSNSIRQRADARIKTALSFIP